MLTNFLRKTILVWSKFWSFGLKMCYLQITNLDYGLITRTWRHSWRQLRMYSTISLLIVCSMIILVTESSSYTSPKLKNQKCIFYTKTPCACVFIFVYALILLSHLSSAVNTIDNVDVDFLKDFIYTMQNSCTLNATNFWCCLLV